MQTNTLIAAVGIEMGCIFAAVILSLTAVRKYKKGTISQKGSFMLQITAIILFFVAVLIGIFTKPNV